MKPSYSLFLAFGAVLTFLAVPAAAAADCGTIDARASAAATARNLDAMKALHPEAAACSPVLANWLGGRIATALYNSATAKTPADEEQLIASLEFGRNWQTLATLGDLASARRDPALAARRYQEALVEIADAVHTPTAPPPAVILLIRKRAEQAGLLAPSYVPSARNRDGSNAGLAAVSIRGIKVTAVALPIQFAFDSTKFTDSGRAAVADLAQMLGNERPARILLIGHTDRNGEDAYNLALSRSRAEAVRTYLVQQGIRADIAIEGRGETEPYRPDDAGRYTQDELDQMSRRVELRRP